MQDKQLKIIQHYGFENQVQKLWEEIGELRWNTGEANFIEEMADVLNVMQGIIAFKGWDAKIKEIQVQKLDRQLERMKNDETNRRQNTMPVS